MNLIDTKFALAGLGSVTLAAAGVTAAAADAPGVGSILGTGAMALAGRVIWRAIQTQAQHSQDIRALQTSVDTLSAEMKNARQNIHGLRANSSTLFARLDSAERALGLRDDEGSKSEG